MPIETNKDLILEFYQAFDQRNIDQAFTLLASDFVAHLAGIPETLDIDSFKEFGMMFYSAFTDGQHQFEQIIAAEDKVVTCGTFTATHTGTFQGLPATGKQIAIAVMHIDRIEQGKIAEHWAQGDAQGLIDLSENKQHLISQWIEAFWLNKYSSQVEPIFNCCRLFALATIKFVIQ